jgi:hypothetical protein
MRAREKEIADFQRQTHVTCAIMLVERDLALGVPGEVKAPEIIFKMVRRNPGCGGLPDWYIQRALSLWIRTRHAVEPEMQEASTTRH